MKRVLVVEDDDPIRELLVALLADEGYAVAAAVNGQAGLARCAAFHPDLVVLDLMMPVLGGAGFLSQRAAHNCTALVVVTSAAGDAATIPDGAEFSAFIAKPFDIEKFTARVHAVMATASS